jgi:hypothetical protein
MFCGEPLAGAFLSSDCQEIVCYVKCDMSLYALAFSKRWLTAYHPATADPQESRRVSLRIISLEILNILMLEISFYID